MLTWLCSINIYLNFIKKFALKSDDDNDKGDNAAAGLRSKLFSVVSEQCWEMSVGV